MMYITEGTNTEIVSEFTKIRTEMLKDKISFTMAIESKDYKKARTIAHGINARCELFYRKLETMDITKSEALVGTAAKVVRDTATALGVLFVAVEGSIKAMEVVRGYDLKKSEKKEVRKIVNKSLLDGDAKKQTVALLTSGSFDSVVKICSSIISKVNNGKEVNASDLNSYFVEIKQKMKVLCVKSKMLINEVDIAEKKFGALDKKKELEKELNDAKNILKESENIEMDYIYNEGVISRALAKSDNTPKAKTVYNAWCSPDKPISKENVIRQIKRLESSNKLNSDCGWHIIQVLTTLDYPQSKFNKIAEKINDSKDAKYMFGVTYDDPDRVKKEKDAYDEYIKGKYKIVAHDGFGNYLIYSIKNGKFFDYFHEEDCGDDLNWLKTGVTYKDAINYTKKQLLKLDSNMKESEELVVNKSLVDIALENFDDIIVDDIYMTETFSNPIRKFKNKIEEIKEAKPGQSDTPDSVKEFVDKHYDDIVQASKILEKEPDKLTKSDIIDSIGYVVAYLSGYGIVLVGLTSGSIPAAVLSIIGAGLIVVASIISMVITWVRRNNDVTVVKNLTKIKAALQKIDTKKLPPDTKKKIEKLIEKINDAETDIYAKFKNVKESTNVDPEILAVYEACQNGSITEEQREELIESIKLNRSLTNIMEETSNDEDDTLKEKYNEVKRLVYERCANGEFSEDTREIILKKAHDKIYNVTESEATPAVQPMQTQSATKEDPETKKALDEMNKNIEKDMKET